RDSAAGAETHSGLGVLIEARHADGASGIQLWADLGPTFTKRHEAEAARLGLTKVLGRRSQSYQHSRFIAECCVASECVPRESLSYQYRNTAGVI
ncbi:unnamed protein product, partial [Mycena citricolor]